MGYAVCSQAVVVNVKTKKKTKVTTELYAKFNFNLTVYHTIYINKTTKEPPYSLQANFLLVRLWNDTLLHLESLRKKSCGSKPATLQVLQSLLDSCHCLVHIQKKTFTMWAQNC